MARMKDPIAHARDEVLEEAVAAVLELWRDDWIDEVQCDAVVGALRQLQSGFKVND